MKKSELAFAAVLVPLDFLLILAAAVSAYTVRLGFVAGYRPVLFAIPFGDYLSLSAAISAVFVLFMAMNGLYAVSGPRRLRFEVSRVFFACSTAIMTVIVIIFLRGELFSSRFIVFAAWAFAVAYVSAGRIAVRLLQRLLLRVGIGIHRVAIIGGDDRSTRALNGLFSARPGFGYEVVKRYPSFDDGAAREMEKLRDAGQLDEIIVTDPNAGRGALTRILGFAESRHLTFKYSADLLATHARHIEIMTVAGVPIVEIKGTRLDGWGRIFKRIFDVIVSLILIIVTAPIMVAVAIAIKLDSPGTVFFSKLPGGEKVTRVGEGGAPFVYFKFRSMKPDLHWQRYNELAALDTREGPVVKIKNDPRVTRIGSFIRKTSLDELPELFLVLAGSMSLVGPRPHLPEEVAKYEAHHRKVLTVKPGITGMAQVSGRADLDFEEEVKLDTYYIENWSPWLDMFILAKTPFVVFSKKGAS